MKTRLLIIIIASVILVSFIGIMEYYEFTTVPQGVMPIATDFLNDKNITVSNNTPKQLEAILEHCFGSKVFVGTVSLSYSNNTHFIDTITCEWIETEDIFTEPMKNAIFDKEAGHYDYLSINNNPNMMAMEKIQLQDDNSIHVEFGQNNYEWSTGYKPIPEFEYNANFKVNDTFVVLCTNIGKDGYADFHPDLSKPYLPGLGIMKYLGPITIENEPILLFWHESASIQVDMSCSYPEMIHHSINLWQLQESGLPTNSIVNALGSNYQN